ASRSWRGGPAGHHIGPGVTGAGRASPVAIGVQVADLIAGPPLEALVATISATIALLIGSNIFMTLAWYGHLRWLDHRAWYVAVVAAWAVAFFEYALQVPANRIGFTKMS